MSHPLPNLIACLDPKAQVEYPSHRMLEPFVDASTDRLAGGDA